MDAREMQARSAAKRWAGLTPEERSAKMKKVRAAALKKRPKKKPRASSANYGNDGFVAQGVTKEQRAAGVKGPIVGNWKNLAPRDAVITRPQAQERREPEDDGSVPF